MDRIIDMQTPIEIEVCGFRGVGHRNIDEKFSAQLSTRYQMKIGRLVIYCVELSSMNLWKFALSVLAAWAWLGWHPMRSVGVGESTLAGRLGQGQKQQQDASQA